MVVVEEGAVVAAVVVVREYNPKTDLKAVEEVERQCEVSPPGKLSLYTDLLGDPMARLRHSPAPLMLVAEIKVAAHDGRNIATADGERREIVGMIRGSIKSVTTCCTRKHYQNNNNTNNNSNNNIIITKMAYMLGLRVSPSHRRMGIGKKLVQKMEERFRENGAEYSYIATENDNQPSLNLFTKKCGYSRFRTPAILVHPVFEHRVRVDRRRSAVFKLSTADAEALYRRRFSSTEFFPRDIDAVLSNRLNLGTFVAVPAAAASGPWLGAERFLESPPESWAVLSVWNCMEVFKLEVRGASRVWRALAKATRVLDRGVPWLRLPSVPDIFRPFGVYFLYGLGGEGPKAARLMKSLWGLAHNLARESSSGGCGVVVAEVGGGEEYRRGIPHWRRLSCAEDQWCIKRLQGEEHSCDGSIMGDDWTKAPPGLSIFVDPREF